MSPSAPVARLHALSSSMGGGPHEELLCALPLALPEKAFDGLKHEFPHIAFRYVNTTDSSEQDGLKEKYKSATILLTLFDFPEPSAAPNLEFVQLFSAGANQIMKQPVYTDTEIPVATMSGVHGPPISEWVLMSLLTLTHDYKTLYELQKRHEWGKQDPKRRAKFSKVRDLVDQRVGVLGYGSIGRQVARLCKAAGMQVLAFTASPKDTPEKRKDDGFIVPGTGDPDGSLPDEWFSGKSKEALHEFLGQKLDVLVISVPLTDATRGMIGKEEFEVLSKHENGCILSNIARGPIVQTDALVEALEKGKLRGAALDVTDPEPLPEDSPLWEMEQVVLTPHVSGTNERYVERAFQVLSENLRRKARGDEYLNQVQRKRGY